MRQRSRSSIALVAAVAFASIACAQQTAAPRDSGVEKKVDIRQSSPWWLEISLKARSMLVDPADATKLNEVTTPDSPIGVTSPDGKHIAYVGSDPQRVKVGHDFDLFVAEVDPDQPSGKANVRRLTADQIHPSNPIWLPSSDGIVFLAQISADDDNEIVWVVELKPDSAPTRLSDERAERAWQPSITPEGRIAWVQLNARKSKEQFSDLIVQRAPNQPGRASEGGGRSVILHDQHISSYAFSPDGQSLAWSGLGSMFIVNLEAGTSREIPLHGIHRQLLNHSVYQFAWRPDGKVLAICCGFLGGIARSLDGDPNAPWPRMFAEDKVFFIPASWTPSPESLDVGEGANYPSPTADDPKAEISPPAGDESKPWWVRDLPMRPLGLKWISADEAQARISQRS